jgi:hypothetical protein
MTHTVSLSEIPSETYDDSESGQQHCCQYFQTEWNVAAEVTRRLT